MELQWYLLFENLWVGLEDLEVEEVGGAVLLHGQDVVELGVVLSVESVFDLELLCGMVLDKRRK